MVVALRGPNTTTFKLKSKSKSASSLVVAVVVVSMIWWNSAGDGRKGGVFLFVEGSITNGRSSGIWSNVAPSNVGIAVAVTAMAGIALAATLVYSRRGSLKSPWSCRKRKNALSAQHWKNLFTPDGRFYDGGVKFLKKVRSGVTRHAGAVFENLCVWRQEDGWGIRFCQRRLSPWMGMGLGAIGSSSLKDAAWRFLLVGFDCLPFCLSADAW